MISLLLLAALGADPCLDCHVRETPALVETWKASAHGGAATCTDCHGSDHAANHPTEARRRPVEVSACAPCHGGAAKDHLAGAHGRSLKAGQGCTRNLPSTPEREAGCATCHAADTAAAKAQDCARFLAQSPAMQRQGCMACHGVENRCDACHGTHDTDLALVRTPAVCATCHMGPDHAQWEMWKTSRHGIVHDTLGPARGPDCARCHMPGGTHDVSRGITMGLAGQPIDPARRQEERARMLDVCTECHGRGFSGRNLADADAIQQEAKALVDEAEALVRALAKEGLLEPAPAGRPPHPLSGAVLELGPQMLYENLSGPEAIFFRMKKFHYVSTYKGAFHQNPDYAHWYGNAPLKLALSELRSEAAWLRRISALEAERSLAGQGPDEVVEGVERQLRELKALRLRDRIDEATYRRRQDALLDAAGL